MSLNQHISYQRLTALYLVLTVGLVCCWLPWIRTGQAEDAGVQIVLTSTPPLEHIRPDTDLARVTLTALLHGQPLSQGHMQVQLTAPPQTKVVATGFPRVEGTALLALDTALTDGTWTVQYLFPIRGTYTFDVGIAPVPGGPVFQPTRLRQTVHISENPTVVRNAGMLIGGLFLLGGITGIIFARSAAAREKLWSRAIIGLLIGLGGALVPVYSAWPIPAIPAQRLMHRKGARSSMATRAGNSKSRPAPYQLRWDNWSSSPFGFVKMVRCSRA